MRTTAISGVLALFILFLAACGSPQDACLPHETYDPATNSCNVTVLCGTEEDCDDLIASLYQGYEVDLEFPEMKPEDCLSGEKYDTQKKACYIECDTDAECQALAEQIYSGLDVYFSDSFRGAPSPPTDNCAAQNEDEETPIACYGLTANLDLTPISVNKKNEDSFDTNPERHREIWEFTRNLLPKTILQENAREYHVFTDGPDGIMAYVSPLANDPAFWMYAIDVEDAPDPVRPEKDFIHTLIHEFAHILTLKKDQVPPDPYAPRGNNNQEPSQIALNCTTFYTGEGCSTPQSIINLFYQRFWADIYEEFQTMNDAQTEGEYQNLAQAFYEKYKDRFVTEYAATNPGEDIAETFTYFVLKEKPDGSSVADQKVRFFYAFPHLVRIRTLIRSQLARQVAQ